jgi:hypothetical protein
MTKPGRTPNEMLINDFNKTIDTWITDLGRYNLRQLLAKPSPSSWSLGQVYEHLIFNTEYFLEQVRICATTNDHSSGEMSTHGRTMFQNNEFPDELIEGPLENRDTPQPDSKEELVRRMLTLKEKINNAHSLISGSPLLGKTKHPGLKYLNATEWFQFAEMHFRHHSRQKKRIDIFLRSLSHPA